MSYYTWFSLDFDTDNDAIDEDSMIKCLENTNEIEKDAAANVADLLKWGGDSWTWYNYEEDMLKVSTLFPDVTFHLTGEGEDREDNWATDYCNGEVTRRFVGKITWKEVPIN